MQVANNHTLLFPSSRLKDISYAIRAATGEINRLQAEIDDLYVEVSNAALGMNYGNAGAYKKYDEAHKKINSLFSFKSLLERKVKAYEDIAKGLLSDRSQWEAVSNTIW